jgi:putrescine transport system ATP-binding protein
LIQIESVTKRYGGLTAVDGVSLEIAAGEFFALLGPSGCGKTTLMRLIAGFEAPDAGRILIDGVDMTGVPPHRRPVNMMFQSYALFPHLDVAGNIGFGLVQMGLPKSEIAARVAAMLRFVQLAGLEKRKPDQLSGGQRQRVALARALARSPKLLLLDEPLGALDRKLREETQFELMRVQRELGTSFVLVTHDQDEAMIMAQRIALMREGRIEQVGSPRDIYERPDSIFAADFVGEINLLRAHVLAQAGECVELATSAGVVLRANTLQTLAIGQEVTLALRPDHVQIVPAQQGLLQGGLVDETYRGGAVMLRVALADGTILRVAPPRGAAPAIAAGAPVGLTFAAVDARVLLR